MPRPMWSALLLLVACAKGPAEAVDPVWGKQPCDHCVMLISEPQPAAQLVLPSGQRKFFDDIGCMIEWVDQSAGAGAAMWVRSPDGERWVDAFKARYRAGQRTPMDYGFLAAQDGHTFQEVRALLRNRPRPGAERSGP
jgi:copper chaperone NosL